MNAAHISSIVLLLRLLEGATPSTVNDAALDDAFTLLGRTHDPAQAERLDREISLIWGLSGDLDARHPFERATACLGAGDYETALRCLQETLDLDPLFAEAWNLRATVWFLLGEHGKALTDLARVLVLEPRHYSALSAIGHILMREHEFEGAKQAFQAALLINPHFAHAHEALARLTKQRSESGLSSGGLTF